MLPMAGNPKESKWHNGGSRDSRKRRKIELSLSDEARARLEELAPPGRRSEFVEGLIMAVPLKGKKT